MRNLFFKLFSDTPTGCGIEIASFNIWHFAYLFVIFGSIFLGYRILKNKSVETKEKVLGMIAFLLMFSYLTDFFVHDFVYASYNETTGEYTNAGLNMDKLPFHICTSMGVIVTFAQFNKRFHRFLEPIAAIAIVGPLMYLCYPSTGVGGEPWCYRVFQTLFFHGLELAWGILTVATGKTTLRWKNIWKAEVLLIGITLWAKLGCTLLEYNWMFLLYNPFGITAIDLPWLLPIIVPSAIFLVVVAVYGIHSGIVAFIAKYAKASKNDTPIPFEASNTLTVQKEVAASQSEEQE